jgi:hypothetical protein
MHLSASFGPQELFIILLVLYALLNFRRIARNFEAALEAFRGGPRPPSPSHPLPANDSWLLNRRRLRKDRGWFR